MKTKYHIFLYVASIVLVVIGVVVFSFRHTFEGLYRCHVRKWEEDAFRGKLLSQLNQHLMRRNESLDWCDPVGFSARTQRKLKEDERVMRLRKGKPYPYFRLGMAQNAGFVVIRKTANGEVVVDILRTIYIDAP